MQGVNAGARDVAITLIDQSGGADRNGHGGIAVSDEFTNHLSEWRDIDGDGVLDADDAFPGNPAFTTDADADGIPDANDADNDNDGIPDAEDPAP